MTHDEDLRDWEVTVVVIVKKVRTKEEAYAVVDEDVLRAYPRYKILSVEPRP